MRCVVDILFCALRRLADMLDDEIRAPCPPINSSHPLSKDFDKRWPVENGSFNIFCEDKGVKNHI